MKKILLILFLGLAGFTLCATAINVRPSHAQPIGSPSLSQVDRDVAKSMLNARLAMRDVAECNLYMLGRIAGILSQEKYNLMRLQGYTFDKVTEMAQRLHEIMSQMEDLMPGPDGPEKVALETSKTALSMAGLVPGFNLIAYGASTTIQLGEIYAQVHNATQAADIAEGIKQNAQQQLDAFQGAVDLYNDIVSGIAEIDGYQQEIQRLLDTYEERCLKKGGDAGQPTENIVGSPSGSTPLEIEHAVHQAVSGLDKCDLPSLIALNNVLTAELNKLYAHQQDLFGKIMAKSSELEAALNNLEQGLPQQPNLGWEGVKAGLGKMVPGAAGVGVGIATQIVDMQLALDHLQAGAALKEAVREKLSELEKLVREHDELIKVIKDVREHQEEVQDLIETWEERCLEEEDDTALRTGDGAILIGSDGTEWCTYGYGGPTTVPVSPVGGGTFVPTGGDGGTSAPPPGTPTGSTPGGPTTPPPPPEDDPVTPGGGTPEDGDDPKDEPTGPQAGGPPGTTFIPLGGDTPDDPKDEGEDDNDDPGDGPQLIIKAKQSVLQSGGGTGNAVAGQQIKLFADSTVNVALPGTRGAKKNDADYDAEPLQCTTGKDGECRIDLPPGTFQGDAPDFEANINVTEQASVNVQVEPKNDRPAASMLPGAVQQYATDTQTINGKTYVTLTYPAGQEKTVRNLLENSPDVLFVETNFCRDKQPGPKRYPPPYSYGGIAGQAIDIKEAR